MRLSGIHTFTEFTSQLIGTMRPLTNYMSEHCRQSEVSPCPCCWRNKPDKDVWVTYPTLFIKTWCKQVWKRLQCFIPASLPFLRLRLPQWNESQGSTLESWLLRPHEGNREWDLRCRARLVHSSAVTNPLWRPGLSWLTGVSNDSRSEVMSQRKHTGLAQLQADLTSPRTAQYGKRFRCLLKTDDAMHSN